MSFADPSPTGHLPPRIGPLLRALRVRRGYSQLALALHTGVSQRHLSCLETGKAQPSQAMLLALMDALGVPLAERNQALMAAGFAPHYPRSDWDAQALLQVRDALRRLLKAHEPAPAMLLDAQWNLLETNAAVPALMRLIGFVPGPATPGEPLNLLDLLLRPDGLQRWLIDAPGVAQAVRQRAEAEAPFNPALAARLQAMPSAKHRTAATLAVTPRPHSPVLLLQLQSGAGVLSFMSAYTTLGSPMDVTLDSLRIDHLLPADVSTREALERALG
ncbi:MmyB family transcriptional regulator [Acidovorax sp. LjRoot194]|uniref:helix-turn-helix domain-containing protein n=1 Tax=Acidovorax sp. LjRoot194 TaxID=3342280 RepID=UPI003ECE4A67